MYTTPRIRTQQWITRDDLKNNRRTVYVFGDNLEERGFGGQAKAMRGEPNAFGIPTKRSPSHHPSAFFYDADFSLVRPLIDERFHLLETYLQQGGTVVFPADGIGTGLADLPRHAPQIDGYIKAKIADLFTRFSS